MKFKVLRNNIFINWQKGGVILKKKVLHILHYVVLNCYRTPIEKFHFEMLLFCVAQGLITLKWAKQKKFFTLFEVAPEAKCFPLFV